MIRFVLLALLLCSTSHANTIEFSEQELAPETVLPIFPRTVFVKNRNVQKTNSIEVQPFFGLSLNNQFFDSYDFGGSLGFHLNEEHSLHVMYSHLQVSKSQYATAIENMRDASGNIKASQRFDAFPKQESFVLLNYEYSPFYGKMSFSKWINFNTDITVSIGGGAVLVSDERLPAVSLGIGQRFYIANWLGLRFSVYSIFYRGIDYLFRQVRDVSRVYNSSELEKEMKFDIVALMGFSVLL